jgi:hypothetical protein
LIVLEGVLSEGTTEDGTDYLKLDGENITYLDQLYGALFEHGPSWAGGPYGRWRITFEKLPEETTA